MSARDEAAAPIIHERKSIWQQHRGFHLIDTTIAITEARPPARLVYEMLHVGPVAAVLPYDRQRDEFVLLRQFRIGAHLAHGKGLNVEIVAGRLTPDEDPLEGARRELAEETGLTALSMTKLFEFAPAPAGSDEYAIVYLAEIDANALRDIAGLEEEQETILPFRLPIADAKTALLSGAFRNGYTIAALSWFFLTQDHAS